MENLNCDIPPEGWFCTRGKGHAGPCAAIEIEAGCVNTDCNTPFPKHCVLVNPESENAVLLEQIDALKKQNDMLRTSLEAQYRSIEKCLACGEPSEQRLCNKCALLSKEIL